jgi:hypothetical protein
MLSEIDFRIANLHTDETLANLTLAQVGYVTYLALAPWSDFPILLGQVSRQSALIHDFLSSFVSISPLSDLEAASTQRDTPLFFLLEYAIVFDCNGATISISGTRNLSRNKLVAPDRALSAKPVSVADALYSTDVSLRTLGGPPNSVTSYYDLPDFTQEEQRSIDLLAQAHISVNNTIIIRDPDRY